MNAKEYLSQAYLLEKQVQSKQDQIRSYRELLTCINARLGEEPVKHTRNVEIMQDTILKIMAAEEELNRQIDALVDKKLEIAEVISRVQHVVYRLILAKRYLCFLSRERIAVDLNYSAKSVQRLHRQAIEAVQEILDQYDPFG